MDVLSVGNIKLVTKEFIGKIWGVQQMHLKTYIAKQKATIIIMYSVSGRYARNSR